MAEMDVFKEKLFDLENELEKTRLDLHDLATMGTLITSILDLEIILSVVMEMSIRTVEGEVGLIQLQEHGELVTKVAWGVDDMVIGSIIYKDDKDVSRYCFDRRAPVVLNDLDRKLKFGPVVSSLLALPIKSRAKCHGTIVIINKTGAGGFTEEDRINLEMLVNFAAVAIDNSILLRESVQKQKIEHELTIARQIQEAILPGNDIQIKGVEIGRIYRPARFVGGDFYDIIKIDEDDFMLVIGDVSNKGIPAAMLMSASTAIIRSELMKSPAIKPSQLMSNLNDVLCNGVIKSHDMFVTLFIARFSLKRRKAAYCNAGHLPPLYWDARNNKLLELSPGGTFVGQFPDVNFKEGVIDISRGDRFLAFTDGVTEAEDIHNSQFGVKRLKQAFLKEGEMSAGRFCIMMRDWVERFVEEAGEESLDDLTLLAIKIQR